MKKVVKKVVCIVFAVVVLAMSFPLSAFAVDPVSVATIFNGFAQAITAYGASHGVSMTFDVTNTNGIGETMHELWSNFRSGQQSADDYETIARAVYPGLYNKVMQAGEAVIGVRMAAEYVAELDDFWNWVLSGPAEMVKVDNEYYQFSQSQIGSGAVPISVVTINTSSFANQPIPTWNGNSEASGYAHGTYVGTDGSLYGFSVSATTSNVYIYAIAGQSNIFYLSIAPFTAIQIRRTLSSNSYRESEKASMATGDSVITQYSFTYTSWTEAEKYQNVPLYASQADAIAALKPYIADPSAYTNGLGIRAYDSTGVVDIPDNDDVNYQPLPYVGGLDIPWDDSLFGDGTGTLTDAQTDAITGALDNVITRDGTLSLAGEDAGVDDPTVDDNVSSDPGDYAVPGLGDVFPFCLPYDIYNFLSALAAEPVAPHFTATLQFPAALGGNQTIDIDFDNPTFNQLAQLLRLLELLAFIVGLALLTRSMFIRG